MVGWRKLLNKVVAYLNFQRVEFEFDAEQIALRPSGRTPLVSKACVVVNRLDNQVVMFGQRALQAKGRLSDNFAFYWLLERGRIVNPTYLKQFINLLWQKSQLPDWAKYVRPITWLIPANLPPVVIQSWQQLGADLGLMRLKIVDQLTGLQTKIIRSPAPKMLVSIGGDLTQVGYIKSGSIEHGLTLNWGRRDLVELLLSHFIAQEKIEVGWQKVSQITDYLLELPEVLEKSKNSSHFLTLRGRNTTDKQVKVIKVSTASLQKKLLQWGQELTAQLGEWWQIGQEQFEVPMCVYLDGQVANSRFFKQMLSKHNWLKLEKLRL